VPALRAARGATLEGRYEADGDTGAANLARMLGVRLEFTAEARERARLHQRVAEQRELVLATPRAPSTRWSRRSTRTPPTRPAPRASCCGSRRSPTQDARAAEALEKAAADPRVGAERVAVLRDLAGIYDERLIDPRAAERTWRRLLENAGDDAAVAVEAATALERVYRGLGEPLGPRRGADAARAPRG
jgi:hypothetical protein